MNDVQEEKNIEFLKFLITEFMQKVTSITTSMNDVTNQIRALSTISMQSPTRSEILAKIAEVITEIKDQLDSCVVENIQNNHKEITAFHQINYEKITGKMDNREKDQLLLNVDIRDAIAKVKGISDDVDSLSNKVNNSIKDLSDKIDALVNTISNLYKILIAITAITPILWGIFKFASSLATVSKP